MADPLHVSREVREAADSTRTPDDARFDAWLKRQPDVRRFIAESVTPSTALIVVRLAYASGQLDGYARGFSTGIGDEVAAALRQ